MGLVTFAETKYGDLSGQDISLASLQLGNKGIGSLEGSPKIFRGTFNLNGNDLKNLKDSPSEIYGNAIFSDNLLTSLKGNLKTVIGNLNISDNPLKSLDGNIRKVTGMLFAESMDAVFASIDDIENALMAANIVVNGEIITDFGPFKQDAQKIADFSKNQRIGILQKFI